MMAVALGNALAGTLLLRAAGALDKHSFESIAEAVGGRSWRVSARPAGVADCCAVCRPLLAAVACAAGL